MWQTLMDWLPDLRVGTFELRDLFGLVLATLGTYLAWLAIKMGREQDAVTERQTRIAEGQRSLLEDLSRLESRQSELAEFQHQLLRKEQSRKPLIKVTPQDPTEYKSDRYVCVLSVANVGDLAAQCVYWTVLADKHQGLLFEPVAPSVCDQRYQAKSEYFMLNGLAYVGVRGHFFALLPPQGELPFCQVTMPTEYPWERKVTEIELQVAITTEFGRTPLTGTDTILVRFVYPF